MPAIIRRVPWARQPPSWALALDPDNPLAQGIRNLLVVDPQLYLMRTPILGSSNNGNYYGLVGHKKASTPGGIFQVALGSGYADTSYVGHPYPTDATGCFTFVHFYKVGSASGALVETFGPSSNDDGTVTLNSNSTLTATANGDYSVTTGAIVGDGLHTVVFANYRKAGHQYLWLDGVLIDSSGTSTAQQYFTSGKMTVGANTTGTVSLGIAGHSLGPNHAEFALAFAENPWRIFRPLARPLYFGAASGGVTVALTGQSATVGEGALGPQTAVAASGVAATSTEGALAPSSEVPVGGQAAVFTGGQLLPDLRATLTGQSLAAAGGVFGVSLAPSLAGVTSTTGAGSLANALAVALAGEAATLAQGTLTASTGSNVTVALTGLAATLALGAFGPVASIGLAGEAAAASGGAVGLGTAASLTGQTAGAAQGALAPQVGITLAGEAANASAGFLAPSLAAYLSGETINSYYGLVTVGGQVLTPDPFFVVPTLSRNFTVPTLTRQFRVS